MYITTIWEGQNYQTLQRETSTWFMTIIKVIILNLLNYTFPLIPKLHGKMKQKLALLWERINAENWVFFVPYHISWQLSAIRCVLTIDYSYFSCCHNSKIALSNQNICTNELIIVLLGAFLSDELSLEKSLQKIVTRMWTRSGPYFTDILHVICTKCTW